jgi:uncharacterized protein YndB with AHSA1/START domain
MPEATPAPSTDRVVSEMEIAAPPERVFEALVDEKQLVKWWGSEPSVELIRFEMDARVGGQWRFESKPREGEDHGVSSQQLGANKGTSFQAHGQVLELERPRRLAYTWIANWHQHPTRPTTVTWELERKGPGTLVRVVHSGLSQEPATSRDEYGGGWDGVLGLLQGYLAPAKTT